MSVAVRTGAPEVTVAPVLDVRSLRVERRRPGRTDTIVSSVSLTLGPGETIGIVGESGSGKSMTAKAITGLLPPTVYAQGEVLYGGRNLLDLRERESRAVRGREIGLVLQDPFTMLNPVMRCGTILSESLLGHHWFRRSDESAEAVRRLAEVGINDAAVVERYPFQLSGGMRQRVAIAAALCRDPQVLIADEPSTALDVATQKEILALIKRIQQARGMGLVLITHDLRVAFAMCQRIYVLYAGSLVEVAPSVDLEAEPLHPYSHGLLVSEPPDDRRVDELVAIPGSVPAPDDVAHSCPFEPRCQWAAPVCRQGPPALVEVQPGRLSACVRLNEIRLEMGGVREQARKEAPPQAPVRRADALIQVRDARKVFQDGNRRVDALGGVSIDVGANESVGIVGESGSGKTTLARVLVGLERLTSGEVTIDGISTSNWANISQKDLRKLRGTVQIVFQDPYSSLNPMRSVEWTLREAIKTHDPQAKNLGAQVADLLGSVGLPASYAQRKPVALVRRGAPARGHSPSFGRLTRES